MRVQQSQFYQCGLGGICDDELGLIGARLIRTPLRPLQNECSCGNWGSNILCYMCNDDKYGALGAFFISLPHGGLIEI